MLARLAGGCRLSRIRPVVAHIRAMPTDELQHGYLVENLLVAPRLGSRSRWDERSYLYR